MRTQEAVYSPVDSQGSATLSQRRIVMVFIGLMLGVFLAALDQMIVSVAIRTIGDALHGLSLQAWVTTAYLITSTVSTPLYGKLSDIYGRKPFFVTAIVIFIAGSAACAFANSMYMLAAFRAFQGLGAGGLMSLALATIGDIVPPRERAKYQAYFLAVFGTSSVLGPVVGGFLAGKTEILHIAGWRWVFLVNVPIAAIALIVVARVLNIPHTRRNHRIDWWGALAVNVCLVPLLIVAEQGRQWGWHSHNSYLCYGIGGAGLVLFIVAEALMGEEALIPLRLFRNGIFSVTSVVGIIIGAGMFGGLAVIPLYLQIAKGASPTKAGLLILPIVIGISLGSVISGRMIARTGRYKVYPLIGTMLMVIGMLLLDTVDVDTSLSRTNIWMFIFGLGLGNCMQTLIVAVQNAVPARDMGVASSSATFFRQMGATIGTAASLSVLFDGVARHVDDEFRHAQKRTYFQDALNDPQVLGDKHNAVALAMLHDGKSQLLLDSSFLQHTDPRLARPFLLGFTDAMHPVFLVSAAILVVGFVLLLFMKQIPLRTQSGLEARMAEEKQDIFEDEPEEFLSGLDALDEIPIPPLPQRHAIHGQVLRSGGERLGDVALTLIDSDGHQLGRAISHSDGKYELSVPRPGHYVLVASAHGHQPKASLVTVGSGLSIVDVVLSGTGALVGCVSTAGLAPVGDATATIANESGEVVASTTTEPNGHYCVSNLVGGSYTLVINARHYRPVALAISVPAGGQTAQNVELPGLARLRGVANTYDGRHIADARISLIDSTGALVGITETDDDGEYTFADLPEGEYTVVASGYPRVVSHLRINNGEARHDIHLAHPALTSAVDSHS